MKYFKKTMCMLLASATLLTGCSIGGKEIVLDINTTNSHTVFSVDNMKCDKTEALIYLANYKNLYGTMYDVNLLETDDASNVEKYIRDVTVDELTRIYSGNFRLLPPRGSSHLADRRREQYPHPPGRTRGLDDMDGESRRFQHCSRAAREDLAGSRRRVSNPASA